MQLMYGGYTFDDAEVALQIFRQTMYGPRGTRTSIRHTWNITGWKVAASNAELTSALAAMEAACSVDDQSLGFFDNGVPTVHSLLNTGTLNGVQVIGPVDYPNGAASFAGSGSEYQFKRTYRIRFQADYLASQSNLVEYFANIVKIGTGGPKIVWQESLTGVPQPQQTKAFTKCLLIQSGRSVGYTSPEPPDTPLYGYPFFQNDRAMTDFGSPQRVSKNISTHYPTRWRYVFESASPL